jgi:hypothetical protein
MNFPSAESLANYWKTAAQHVVKYRDTQWTYYSFYRNLFILFVPGSIGFGIVAARYYNNWLGVGAFVSVVLIEVCLFFSLRVLINLYYDILKNFSSSSG